jgi:GH25 family lysozyme M1 (1,4-beta-N-acetylmuramidase)
MQSRNSNNLRGIDISNHQGNIDFAKVKAAGIDVVFTKATEGVGYTDPFLETNYKNAKAAGLKIGFYHYFTPLDENDTRAEAKAFVDVIKGRDTDCRYALDIEEARGLDKATLSNLAKLFLDEVKRLTGKEVVLYTYTNFAQNNLTDVLKSYPLWIAPYGVNTPGINPIWNDWVGFQYSSSGAVDGISGNVDMDEFTKDILLNPVAVAQHLNQLLIMKY